MPDFLLYSLLVGIAIAIVAGPLGSFTVWRKMAYFGDTLAHSALIGVALGLFLSINVALTIVFTCILIAVLLVYLEHRNSLSTDTLLGVISHGSLALGLVCVSLYSSQRVNLFAYLFGDLLTVTLSEVITIYLVVALMLGAICWLWKPLLMITVDQSLAKVEGRRVTLLRLSLMMMVALVIALAMKIVGVMLITALLIIPAATSRRLTSSPEAMALVASVIGVISVILGLGASYWFDIPAGPAVVLAALASFLLTLPVQSRY
ncbi:High-affinity zinc uptake system membrane protein ZnuB [Thalassocella blandensis]|nr:High-affinity zinc uptake system membrane protein ZnuB [Thalassocella blandensis]